MITDGGSCATSPNFPNDYPIDEGCTLYGLPQAGLDVIAFDVEGPSGANCVWDYLVVNGVNYCGTSGPAGIVPSDGTMTWVSDGSVTGRVTGPGWKALVLFSRPQHTARPQLSRSPSPGVQPLPPLPLM